MKERNESFDSDRSVEHLGAAIQRTRTDTSDTVFPDQIIVPSIRCLIWWGSGFRFDSRGALSPTSCPPRVPRSGSQPERPRAAMLSTPLPRRHVSDYCFHLFPHDCPPPPPAITLLPPSPPPTPADEKSSECEDGSDGELVV
ncbi:uncharacterized protein J3R85_017454 [Psidium guajava]|nr:uncharacterized protein J3R85_017454 [Psidium guajava]